MKLAPFKRITSDDVSSNAPSWLDGLLGLINTPIELVTNGLLNNLTLSENFRAEVQTVPIVSGANTTVYLQKLKIRPIFMLVGYANGEIVSASNIVSYLSATQPVVNITFKSGIATPVNTNICFLVG